MTTASALGIVLAYQDAWTGQDIVAAARYLADDFDYQGPLQRHTSAAAFIPVLTRFAHTISPGWKKIAALDGDEECLIMYDLYLRSGATVRSADLFTVNAGWISSEKLIFDTYPLRTTFADRTRPPAAEGDALAVARAYHQAWRDSEFDVADALLAEDLEIDVPINHYATKHEFLAATRLTREMTTAVLTDAEFGNAGQALLIYDMTLPFGDIRIAEQFAVNDGRITGIRHIHDTAAVRAAGLERPPDQ